MGDTDIGALLGAMGKLEGTLGAKLDDQGKTLRTLADEVQEVSKRVGILESDRDATRKMARQSAHDLSEHKAVTDSTNDAIKRHMTALEKQVNSLVESTAAQDSVLTKQNVTLAGIDRKQAIILVATAIGTAIGAALHAIH